MNKSKIIDTRILYIYIFNIWIQFNKLRITTVKTAVKLIKIALPILHFLK
jgi:hypothetical protein